jgi:hypothetical protein
MRLPLVLPFLIALGAGASAFAQAGGGTDQPEPGITARQVLRMTSTSSCVDGSFVTVRAAAPAGVEVSLLRVAVQGQLAARMSGVRGVARVTVHIPRGSSKVRVTLRTLGGQEIHADRGYRTCPPSPPPSKAPRPVERGGGED